MKTYLNPDIPKPKPGKKKGDGRVYAGGPGWRELNPRRKPKPEKPGSGSGGVRMYPGGSKDFDETTGLYRPGSPKEYLNPRLKPKPDKPKPKKSKKGYYSDEEFKPSNKKPGKTRRKFLEKMDKMNREAGY